MRWPDDDPPVTHEPEPWALTIWGAALVAVAVLLFWIWGRA
jgi:hypothetical protein